MEYKNILASGLILGFFGILGALLVSGTEQQTRDIIIHNERMALLNQLYELVPQSEIDNDFLQHPLTLNAPEFLGISDTTAYVGMRQGKLAAVVFEATIPNGYAGPILMLVAVDSKGTLKGVRVVSHSETPGLGDKVELERSDWVLGFNGKSLTNPSESQWKVKKDGGVFDQFTGATITPRAIVNSVRKALLYFDQEHQVLFKRYIKETQEETPKKADIETQT
ncbi:MAG TPA: electron transport complex subunit RsxG [Gammaproteobacteria bacterium]|nr:electron transport complex subunit RsxG [Gammaproteobacteria bacterium]